MISRDLLLANGTIDALKALSENDTRTTSELTDAMELSESTVRRRLNDMEDEGLVELDADIRNGTPVRVYQLTEQGEKAAVSVLTLIGESPEPDPEDIARGREGADTRVEPVSETDREPKGQAEPDDDPIKPSGVSFDGDEEL